MKIGKIYNKVMTEVSSDVYNKLTSEYSDARIIMSHEDEIKFRATPNSAQEIRSKPRGLWYGIGSSWVDWVKSEMPDWETDNVFKIDINESNILIIRNYEEITEFDKEYGVPYRTSYKTYTNIDWGKVANNYGGIEIAPYIYEARRTIEWYYTWDVASGCIWGDGVIKNVEKII